MIHSLISPTCDPRFLNENSHLRTGLYARIGKKFNLQPILAFENLHNWQHKLSTQLYNIRANNQTFLTIITTNATLINQGLQSELKFFPAKTLIIGDEVHNLGSTKVEVSLPRNIGLRLALSATPERYYDEEGTEAIFAYFGQILQPEFGLAEAIKKGALVGYFYYPLLVKLNASEALIYAKLTKRIGWALSKNDKLESNDSLNVFTYQAIAFNWFRHK